MKEKHNFKDTLNLPKTDFPMKANLSQNEPITLKKWEELNLYAKIQEKTKNNPTFILHDGPPYANGSIHVGHLLNKVLKDIVVRSQNMLGNNSPFIPGWDCHGLPIEHKVMTELLKDKEEKLSTLEPEKRHLIIRSECQKYANKYIKLQSEQMKRLLTLGDYQNPYLTMDPKFESKTLEVFANLVKEGIVYRKLKPVHWSIANQTALAEAELEYEDKEDTAIYVKFHCTDKTQLKEKNLPTDKDLFVLIWTTTPWTLPANLAVAVHPLHDYSIVKHENTYLIVATALIESIQKTCNIELKPIQILKGDMLLGLSYTHPFCDRSGKVVAADYVTMEDGTGLVHTAPGHGIEDYQTGLRENLDTYCPVKGNGCYDETVPEFLKELHIWKANPIIVEKLKENNTLLHSYKFMHSYPHDWRSKTPVIFRSTEQWFISVDEPTQTEKKSLRTLALENIENKINFIPDWGKNRLRGMLEARPDWCISRQRSWGLPIPAFKTETGETFMTEASIKAVAKCFEEDGSDAWFKKSAKDCLVHYNKEEDHEAPKDLNLETLTKMYDIFDVWFESGSSWNSVLRARGLQYPADLYLEGSDQHRGWFHLSLLPSLGVTGKAPFKSVLTHGFIVDKNGKKMSKSQGNALNVEDLLKNYGAEVTRWWVSSLAFENDIKVDLEFFNASGESYRKVRNTIRFLLSSIYDLSEIPTPENFEKTLDKTSLDAWILEETSKLNEDVKLYYKDYKFRHAHQRIYNFCNDTLSAIYCSSVKDRLYCDKANSNRRRQSQITMVYILEVLARLIAPILPHTSEELYTHLHTNKESIHLQDSFSLQVTADPHWKTIFEKRELILKRIETYKKEGIENPLDMGVMLPKENALEAFLKELPDLCGVSRVTIESVTEITLTDLRQEPQCERSWKRDETVKERPNGMILSDRDYEAIKHE